MFPPYFTAVLYLQFIIKKKVNPWAFLLCFFFRYSHTAHTFQDTLVLLGGVNPTSPHPPGLVLINLNSLDLVSYSLPVSLCAVRIVVQTFPDILSPLSSDLPSPYPLESVWTVSLIGPLDSNFPQGEMRRPSFLNKIYCNDSYVRKLLNAIIWTANRECKWNDFRSYEATQLSGCET